MKIAIYPGSFDPLTVGHVDIIKASAALFDRVYVAVLGNYEKRGVFTPEERQAQITTVIREEAIANAEAVCYSGLTVQLAQELGAVAIVRGVRSLEDYAYEIKAEAVNRHICPEVRTLFIPALFEHSFVSSSAIKEMCLYGADIRGLVPESIRLSIVERLAKR